MVYNKAACSGPQVNIIVAPQHMRPLKILLIHMATVAAKPCPDGKGAHDRNHTFIWTIGKDKKREIQLSVDLFQRPVAECLRSGWFM